MKNIKDVQRNPNFDKIPNCSERNKKGKKCKGVGLYRLISRLEYNCGLAGTPRLFGDSYVCDYICGEHGRKRLKGMKRIDDRPTTV